MACDVIGIGVSRSEIESRHTQPFNRVLKSFSSTREALFSVRNKVEIFVGGYDDDTRELFEIPEVRQWVKDLVEARSPLCYFLRTERNSSGINLIINCIGDAEVIEEVQGGKLVQLNAPELVCDFMCQQFARLNAFTEKHGLGEDVNREVSDRFGLWIQERLKTV